MVHFSCSPFRIAVARALLGLLLLACGLPAAAQAPAWQSARTVAAATAVATTKYSAVRATAVDAAGNVYLAGSFTNSVVLGGTTLTSLGDHDVFVAKFNPVSNQFAWAQRAGGAGYDIAAALVVSGTSVYVAGSFDSAAGFGTTTLTGAGSFDGFVAKLSDAGSFEWAQRAGGADSDGASALAVSGASVYVAGDFNSSTAGIGPTTLTNAHAGTYDGFVAKLIDAGPTSSFVWAQRVSGTGNERASALAVSGTSVYLAGDFDSPTAGFGATTLANAAANHTDGFVTKLTDAGPTSSFGWAQRAGGTGDESINALAVSGNSVYLAGYFSSPAASFGATTLTTAGYLDGFVAKLTDAGPTSSFGWAQRAGGTDYDEVNAMAVSGNSVYVAGGFISPAAGFGGTILTNSGLNRTYDGFVAKLIDAGPTSSFVWAQRAGGADNEEAHALAVSGTSVYVAGDFNGYTTSFGALILANPNANSGQPVGFLASLTDPTLTATAVGRALPPAQLYPNPARRTVALHLPAGAAPMPLTLTDALGRAVRHYPAPAGGQAVLDLLGLPAGCYLLRGAGSVQRLQVEQ